MVGLKERSVVAILPAAGSGQRFGDQKNKLFSLLKGEPLWVHSARRLARRAELGRLILAVSEHDLADFEAQASRIHFPLSVEFVIGGAERMDSVQCALDLIQDEGPQSWVAVHDAARPLVSDEDLARVFSAAQQTGAAILATPVSGTLKRELGGDLGSETVDRHGIWMALTPQVFSVGLLKQAYAKHNGCPATDDAQLVERLGRVVQLVQGSAENLKITYPEDLSIAEAILNRK